MGRRRRKTSRTARERVQPARPGCERPARMGFARGETGGMARQSRCPVVVASSEWVRGMHGSSRTARARGKAAVAPGSEPVKRGAALSAFRGAPLAALDRTRALRLEGDQVGRADPARGGGPAPTLGTRGTVPSRGVGAERGSRWPYRRPVGRARRIVAAVGAAFEGSPVRTRRARRLPRLALSAQEAADALGMSLRHFERHVQPHLRIRYSGQLRLVPIAELERWLAEQPSVRGGAASGGDDA